MVMVLCDDIFVIGTEQNYHVGLHFLLFIIWLFLCVHRPAILWTAKRLYVFGLSVSLCVRMYVRACLQNSLPDNLRAQQDCESFRQGLKPGFSPGASMFSALGFCDNSTI